MANVPLPPEIGTLLERFINRGGAAEGTNLPPKQTGDRRVPHPSNFHVHSTSPFFGGSVVTLEWTDIELGNVAQYNIYTLDGSQLTLVGSSPRSPATVHVTGITPTSAPRLFHIQVVLNNGLSSDVLSSPSATCDIAGSKINDQFQATGFVWSENSPGAGSIAWSTGVVTVNGISYDVAAGNTANAWVYWQLSSPNAFQSSATAPTLTSQSDYLVAFNTGGLVQHLFELHMSTGHRAFIAPLAIALYNDNNLPSATMSSTGAAGAPGSLDAYDGAGANTVHITGSNGRVKCNDLDVQNTSASASAGGGAATPATVTGFLKTWVGGVEKRVAYYDT